MPRTIFFRLPGNRQKVIPSRGDSVTMNVMTRPALHQTVKGFVVIVTEKGNGHFQSALSSV